MIVEQIMTKNVHTLSPESTVKSALTLMRQHKIRHLPLSNENEEVVGLVTERDIKSTLPSFLKGEALEEHLHAPLSTIMNCNVITGHPLDFVEEIAALFYDHKIGCLPIVNNRKLVGIITSTDLLHTMVELTGANKPGSQLEVRVKNRPGALYEVTAVFHKHLVNVHSVLIYPDPDDEDYQILVFRIATINPIPVIDALKKEDLHVLWPNMPGMSSS
ncbi:acetoin utilization AcuB family protein [Siminovitchia fortis]|uniref:CBS domain-containing protein n=1 Tax=Siminovitchia fortis TaxID=254758 RepID=A0A443IRD6_9BACI|nr:acetoin utilization AcuB family protein [Siminovitchia fortis]RWR09661.1 CBS domain-containing protein [Siminovitchia fortis]WHY82282.1 acetoin utilization AcuB family protein [Siminovitchia fortis]